ncbi:MAG TPA: sigma-54 dependent transcriptional regulator [Phycisphaerae bacterium]|nr:sigma-54 dependent transcriptional regulator [Phycisphaerae bacterium]
MPRVLVVEDELVLAKNVRDKLRAHGCEVAVAHNCRDALAQTAAFQPDAIILDLRLPDGDGLELLPKLKAEASTTSVIVVTAHGNERIAVEAMKAGATEYLTKPVDLDELQLVVDRTVDHQRLSENLSFIRRQEQSSSGLDRIIGQSQAVRSLKETIQRLTRTRALALADPPTVLITGETGSGKDMAARAIHYDGPRAGKPFIHVNCTALPATLFESELFGHLRGAFTSASQAKRGLLEVAEGGTIFLDEIGHMGVEMQAKLLHTIEHREIRPVGATDARPINVHIIAATNRDLNAAVEADEFRRDLYHRLRVVHIHLPPLRERPDDIPQLAEHFMETHCRRFGIAPKRFTPVALDAMIHYPWKGNVRELSHIIESSILQIDGTRIDAADLRLVAETESAGGGISLQLPGNRTISIDFRNGSPSLDEVEFTILCAAFEHTGQNLSRAARLLGITREALRYRLNKGGEKVKMPPDIVAPTVLKMREQI